jgi:chemotaxis protein MotB
MLEAIHVSDDSNAGAGAAPYPGAGQTGHAQPMPSDHPMAKQLAHVADELQAALKSLVDANLVAVRRHEFWLEVEVKTDILFASGEAVLSDKAIPALDALAATLVKYPNPVRVEGHTDNRPINSRYYPSHWELSAARAASVVHRFARAGVGASRLSVIGFGEFRPSQPNDTAAGRDANRRVIIVILAGEGAPTPGDAADIASEASNAGNSAALPPVAVDSTAPQQTTANPAPVNEVTAAPAAHGTKPAPLPVMVGAGAGNPAQE